MTDNKLQRLAAPLPTSVDWRQLAQSLPCAAELYGLCRSELERLANRWPSVDELKRLAALLPTERELYELADSMPSAAELYGLAESEDLKLFAASLATAAELKRLAVEGSAQSMPTSDELYELADSMPSAAQLNRLAESLVAVDEIKRLRESLPTDTELKQLAESVAPTDTEPKVLPKYESLEPQPLTEFPNVAELERLRTFLRLNWQETDKALKELSSKNRTTENNK